MSFSNGNLCWGERHQVWIEGYFLWPEDIESSWATCFGLQSRNSSTHINMIADEHKALITSPEAGCANQAISRDFNNFYDFWIKNVQLAYYLY